jgi:hypothetical protein
LSSPAMPSLAEKSKVLGFPARKQPVFYLPDFLAARSTR